MATLDSFPQKTLDDLQKEYKGKNPFVIPEYSLYWNGEAVRGDRWLKHQIRESTVEGVCSECQAIHGGIEPDAEGYDCSVCRKKGTVDSVLVHLGIV